MTHVSTDDTSQPDRMLADILPDPLPVNDLGHTPLDDFWHFCNYSRLSVERAGAVGFAYAKLAYCTAWLANHRADH